MISRWYSSPPPPIGNFLQKVQQLSSPSNISGNLKYRRFSPVIWSEWVNKSDRCRAPYSDLCPWYASLFTLVLFLYLLSCVLMCSSIGSVVGYRCNNRVYAIQVNQGHLYFRNKPMLIMPLGIIILLRLPTNIASCKSSYNTSKAWLGINVKFKLVGINVKFHRSRISADR